MAKSTYVFTDTYPLLRKGSVKQVIIKADDENEAWEIFAHKWAIGNFGLRSQASISEVKDYFHEYVIVTGPEEILILE